MPSTDTYIEKEAIINDEIDRLRLSATRSLFERRDVIIVASVSCIYGLGSPESVRRTDGARSSVGQRIDREEHAAQARRDPVRAQRRRVPARHLPRARRHRRGFSVATKTSAFRIEFFGDEVDELADLDPLTGGNCGAHDRIVVYPKSHYVTPRSRSLEAIERIKIELAQRLTELETTGRPLEAQRLQQRTMFDLEMMEEIGLLPRHRELLAPSLGAQARASRRRPCSIISRPTP